MATREPRETASLRTSSRSASERSHLASKRLRGVSVFVVVLFAICGIRLIDLQVVQADSLKTQAEAERSRSQLVVPKRGDILDRNGTVLATSVERYNLFVDQAIVKGYIHYGYLDRDGREVAEKTAVKAGLPEQVLGTGAAQAARRLAPLLETSAAELGGQMVGDQRFVYLRKKITPQLWNKIKAMDIDGIGAERVYVREYPNDATAASVIGFVDNDMEGQSGIEATQNKVLSGSAGEVRSEISPTGQVIPGSQKIVKEARDGNDVQLTLDADLQSIAEDALNDGVKRSGGEWGAVVVENVSTGELLVLADSGNQNPDKMRNASGGTSGSRAVQYSFEPGSVGKLVTFATALDKGTITPLSTYRLPTRYTTGNGESFKDFNDHGNALMTATGVLMVSSNIGTIQIGDTVKDQDRWLMMRKLGLGQVTGIEMPGETAGQIFKADQWDARQRYTTMFGQGISVSVLQLGSLAAALGNSGVRMPLKLVGGIENKGSIVPVKDKRSPVTAVDSDTAATMVRMMQSVTAQEWFEPHIKLDGYHFANKTGTAEIIAKNGQLVGTISTLVGLVPAEDPVLSMAVVIYKPNTGDVVAPEILRAIAKPAMSILQVPPITEPPQLYPNEP